MKDWLFWSHGTIKESVLNLPVDKWEFYTLGNKSPEQV